MYDCKDPMILIKDPFEEVPSNRTSPRIRKKSLNEEKKHDDIHICRCCGQLANNLYDMHSNVRFSTGLKLWDWWKQLTEIDLTPISCEYSHVCKICMRKLANAYKFRQQCWMAEEVLRDDRPEVVVTSKVKRTVRKRESPDSDAVSSDAVSEPKPKRRKKPARKMMLVPSVKEETFVCEMCAKTLSIKVISKYHHSTDKPRCRPCYKKHRPTKPNYKKAKEYTCDICNRLLSNRSNLVGHMRRLHLSDVSKNHLCPVCGQSFLTRRDSQNHLDQHTNPTPHECQQCEKKYRTRHGLQSHIKNAHERLTYECPICHETLNRKLSFKIHVLTKHKGGILRCHVCMTDFQSLSNLTLHMRKKHNAKYDQTVNIVMPDNQDLKNQRWTLEKLVKIKTEASKPVTCNSNEDC